MLKKFIRQRLRRISGTLDIYKLTRPTFNPDDDETVSPKRFLGYYSDYGLSYAFEKYGLFKELNKKGYKKCKLSLARTDEFEGKLFIHSLEPKIEDHLIELVLKKHKFDRTYLKKIGREDLINLEFLKIEWLALQDPLKEVERLYPGQKYPGLGLGRWIFEILLIIKWRLGLAGLINVPHYYHNAYFYSSVFKFIDPEIRAHFERIKYEFSHLNLMDLSWRIENKELYFNDGVLVEWFPEIQLCYNEH